ncbi:ABC transporter substrate-binding protein [Falsiroseomonas selenitidurans]|uniref:ABC transporter substrate-binding protein n=1 Tax=Falsiroseomonas selenitidurans TaxID=2716335 RepID=A0ABX1E129_9PROT|nr:ABC transporter substrate-binding protein [Falsiroseomonas selenitidurans]NKC30798.1 ABC transporter substrate-binding protein [Falsiroseomonas selenitidurans]
MKRILLAGAAGLALATGAFQGAPQAQTLRIATSAEATSADPQHYAAAPNSTLHDHVFETLVEQDARLKTTPSLATAWSRRDDTTWVFDLRQGVRFHNGQDFTSADVVFSLCRILNNETELAVSYSSIVRRLARVEAEGPHRVVIATRQPEPLLPADIASLRIIPAGLVPARPIAFSLEDKCAGAGQPWPTLAQFNDGAAAIGTGPFRMRRFDRSGVTELARNDDYWGEKPHWATVRLQPVTAAGPRLAGLLAGDHDIVEAPSTGDIPRLRSNPAIRLAVAPTTRLIFLQLDQREPAPFVNGGTGANPLRDPRVRQALSLAIDRKAIAERVMDGLALPATQFLPEGMFGTIPGLPVLPYDPARARTLLAEAGHAQGFSLVLHATNNRYVNDARVIQAIAQYLNRIGVRAEVDAMPSNVYFGRRARREFSVPMGGWAANAEETLLFFRTWMTSTDRARGLGGSNYAGWSNAAFDAAAVTAVTTMDDAERGRLLREASRIGLEQGPVVPIHFESAVWAFRRGLAYAGRMDQRTLAQEVRPE